VPLTPTDVANKQFRIAFRGYSLDEVDAFLDEVENELSRLLRDNATLKERGGPAPAPVSTPSPAAPTPAAAAPLASMEGQEAALRTLLLAQRTADEAIAEARAEAEEIVSSARAEAESTLGAARSEAESTLTSARAEAERTLSEAQGKAARVDQEVASRIQAATGDLDARRRALEGRIEELRAFEREYRTRLKAYLENQLRELGSGAGPDDSGAGVPAGARTAAVGLTAPPAGPVPVSGPGGPGPVPAAAEASQDETPDGPPREAGSPSTLRAVPPLTSGAAPVGPFTAVPAADASGNGNDADR
jgi:DivIVA domain-containing protein